MRLAEIPPADYAKLVMPLTAPLWGGKRDLAEYVVDWLEIANSGYGRRHCATYGFFDGATPVSSFKRYERAMHFGEQRLSAVGFGAVFTPEEYRGRGYATAMLATALDAARAGGVDVAYLYSDVRPQFYAELGFVELGSRKFALRADGLLGARLEVSAIEDRDWAGVRRCFDLMQRASPAGFVRTPLVWEWMRLLRQQHDRRRRGQMTRLALRRGRGIAAYVLGERIAETDTFALDEFGYADGPAALAIPGLLRAAAGDLRRIAGWVPPYGAREILPRGAVRRRTSAVFMAAPLSPAGLRLVRFMRTPSPADPCWKADHV